MPYHDLTGKQAAKASPFTEYSIPNTLIIFYKGQCNFLPRHCPFFFNKSWPRNVPYLCLILLQTVLMYYKNFASSKLSLIFHNVSYEGNAFLSLVP